METPNSSATFVQNALASTNLASVTLGYLTCGSTTNVGGNTLYDPATITSFDPNWYSTGTAVMGTAMDPNSYYWYGTQAVEETKEDDQDLNGLVDVLRDITKVMTALNDKEILLIAGEWDPSFVERSLRDMKAYAYDRIVEIVSGGKCDEEN